MGTSLRHHPGAGGAAVSSGSYAASDLQVENSSPAAGELVAWLRGLVELRRLGLGRGVVR